MLKWVSALMELVQKRLNKSPYVYRFILTTFDSSQISSCVYKGILMPVLKLEQVAMPKTCENWLGLVNSCIYYVHQTHKI